MLTQKHRDELLKSVPNNELGDRIIALNFSSIEHDFEVRRILNRPPKSKWKGDDLGGGWKVSGVDPKTGDPWLLGVQIKLDNPIVGADGKSQKYLGASGVDSQPLFLDTGDSTYWSGLIEDNTRPRFVTEGAKKAACLMALGQPCISIPGVMNWQNKGKCKGLVQSYLTRSYVFLAFDQDWLSGKDGRPNMQVHKAIVKLAHQIIRDGGAPQILHWDAKYKGIDDYLMSFADEDERSAKLQVLIDESWTLAQFQDETKSLDHSQEFEGMSKLEKDYYLIREKMGDRIRFNELRKLIEIDGEEIDLSFARRDLIIDHKLNVKSSNEDIASLVLKVGMEHKFDPIRDYLDSVKAEYGQDYSILHRIADRYFGAEHPLHQIFVIRFLIAAVARIYDPGCKHDNALILQGGQGINKSTWFKTLAGESWFDDSLGDMGDKDEKIKMHRVWFSEWAELETVFKRKDVSQVKQNLTSATDMLRPPYGRQVVDLKRRSVIVGSTNETEFLADSTGNRRFWVLPVRKKINIDLLREERDRIWAAAVALYELKERWHLEGWEDTAQTDSVSEFQTDDAWSVTISKWLRNPIESGSNILVDNITTLSILVNALGIEVSHCDRASQMRVADAMKKLGWKSVRERVNGTRQRIWVPTDRWEAEVVPTSSGCPDLNFDLGTLETLTTPRLALLSHPGQPISIEELEKKIEIDKKNRQDDIPLGKNSGTGQDVGTMPENKGFEAVPVVEKGLGQEDKGLGQEINPEELEIPIGTKVAFYWPEVGAVEAAIDGVRRNPLMPEKLLYHAQNCQYDGWFNASDLRVLG